MKKLTPSRIDRRLICDLTAEFPAGKWQRVRGSDLHVPTIRDSRARNWSPFRHVHNRGGVYAFLFPKSHFSVDREIQLDGPGRRKIPFRFNLESHPANDGMVVAYVGKAADLHQRFQWHFSLAERNTGAQVQYGLCKSKMCEDRKAAVECMLKGAEIVYLELSGDEQVANRDFLELSLCARFAPPFNIKSEH